MSLTPPTTVPTSPESTFQLRNDHRCLGCHFDSRYDQISDRCPGCLVPFSYLQCTACGNITESKNCQLLKHPEETFAETELERQIEVPKEHVLLTLKKEAKVNKDIRGRTRLRDHDDEAIYAPPLRNQYPKVVTEEREGGLEKTCGGRNGSNNVEEVVQVRGLTGKEQFPFQKAIRRIHVIQEEEEEPDDDDGTVTPRAEPPVLRKHSTRQNLRLDYLSSSSQEDIGDYFNLSSTGKKETYQRDFHQTVMPTEQSQILEGNFPELRPVFISTSTQTQEHLEEATNEVSNLLASPKNIISARKLVKALGLSQNDSSVDNLATLLHRLWIDTSLSIDEDSSSDIILNGKGDIEPLNPTESCPHCRQASCPVCPSHTRDLVVDMDISKTFAKQLRYCVHCPHGFCPRDHVEVVMKCSACSHQCCQNCGSKRTRRVEVSDESGVGVGNWEMGIVGVDKEEERWCVCCRCKRVEEEGKRNKSVKKEDK